MSLLIVRCPLKPLSVSGSPEGHSRDWEDRSYLERFEWCLIEDEDAFSITSTIGIGATESMPYADEVLVLLPTIDVRLIEAKVPLANAKKLQQILPNLIEEYVLTGTQSLVLQALPPVHGNPALQRVIALIDRAWLAWISKQLEGLLSQHIRLIPECFLLTNPAAENVATQLPSVAYQFAEQNLIFSQRTGDQLGVSWIEKRDPKDSKNVVLPHVLKNARISEISWEWLSPSAIQFVKDSASSKSIHYGLNLLPQSFRGRAGKGLARYLKRRQINSNQSTRGGAVWADAETWRQPLQWSQYLIVTIIFGYLVHLSWLVFDDWRWGKHMEVLAAQSLNSASIAKLNQDKAIDGKQSNSAVIDAFTKQVTQDQRRQGLVSDADFVPMAAKLQQLKVAFGPEILQKLDYDGYGINFEFKPGALKLTNEQASVAVMQKARTLGLMVKTIGPDRYRLEPYSGLGL